MPELRKDPVTGRWVIIATDRAQRPQDFLREPVSPKSSRFCPFCPGHESKTPPEILAFRHDGGGANAPGWSLRVVPNKFPALRVEGDLDREGEGIYDRMSGIGAHEVIVETPDHQADFADLSQKAIEDVFWAFRDRTLDLRKDPRLRYVLLFKNHGSVAGATLEHTHSQLIALPVVPRQVQAELDGALRYFGFKERCIYCDIVRQETESGSRLVLATKEFLVLAPYAPRFAFETWIVPRRHRAHFDSCDPSTIHDLAEAIQQTLRRMNKLLETPPYNFVIHTAPLREGQLEHYHWHIEIMPALARLAGFEWGSGFHINPTPPEEAARYLREVSLD